MTEVNLITTLRSLCEIDPPEITGQGIQESNDRSALASLCELGALVHVGNTESVLCLACDRPHSISVEYAGDGQYRAYCPDSGYQHWRASPQTPGHVEFQGFDRPSGHSG